MKVAFRLGRGVAERCLQITDTASGIYVVNVHAAGVPDGLALNVYTVYIGTMSKVILYSTMSIDGFSAGVDDDMTVLHGWAFGDPTMKMHPDASADLFSAGAAIFGARTLRAGDVAWGDEQIFPMPVFVPMHDPRPAVIRNGSLFTFVDSLDEALRLARAAAGDKNVVIMGSPNVAQQLLAAGDIDEISLHLTEVILGGGIPLFADARTAPIRLERLSVLESAGILHVRYRVLHGSS